MHCTVGQAPTDPITSHKPWVIHTCKPTKNTNQKLGAVAVFMVCQMSTAWHHAQPHMIEQPPGTPVFNMSCSNFSLSALDVMLRSLYLSPELSGMRLATQKLNFSASDDDGLSPALLTSSANLEPLLPTATALQEHVIAESAYHGWT